MQSPFLFIELMQSRCLKRLVSLLLGQCYELCVGTRVNKANNCSLEL